MRNVLSVLIVAAATSLTMVAAPAAQAGGDTITGGCYDHTANDPILTNGLNEGVMGDSSVTQDSNGPVFADVVCYIQVNGAIHPGAYFDYKGLGTQSGSNQIAYAAGPGDVAELCQEVVYADTFDSGVTCKPA
jgi:hypothetical protein